MHALYGGVSFLFLLGLVVLVLFSVLSLDWFHHTLLLGLEGSFFCRDCVAFYLFGLCRGFFYNFQ